MRLYNILKKPVSTEKTSQTMIENNRYGFIVDSSATKIDIKKAIKEIYGLDVADVNITYTREKMKYGKKGLQTRRRQEKKAYITLKDKKAKLDATLIK